MANSVDLDERVHYKSSHLDLHCLHRYWFRSAMLKGLIALMKYKPVHPYYMKRVCNFSSQNIAHIICSVMYVCEIMYVLTCAPSKNCISAVLLTFTTL